MNIKMICHCGEHYIARQADLNRGWALSCSKHCAAVRRDFGRAKAKRADGIALGKPIKKKPKSFRKSSHMKPEIINPVKIMFEEDYHALADCDDGIDYLCECGDK